MINALAQIKSRLRMRHLRLLYVVAEEGSLRKAADRLAITQPSATKTLQEIESLFGQTLFKRTAQGLIASVLGAAAIRYAQLVLADLDSLHEEMMALDSGCIGIVRIGAMSALTGDLLPQAIAKVKAMHPKVNIVVQIETSDMLLQALNRDQLDFLLARIPQNTTHEGLNFECFGEEFTCLVARTEHPQQQNKALSLATLSEYPWVLHPRATPIHEIFCQLFREAQLKPPPSFIETASIMLTVSLLQNSDMVAIMSKALANYYQQLGVLAPLPLPLPCRLSNYGLISRSSRQLTPAMLVMCAALREQFQKI